MPTHYVKRKVRENCTDDMSIQVWLSGADETGWQIYKEPKIESPKEPDYVICKRCGGSKSVLNPASTTAYTTCPKCGGTGYEIKPEPQYKVGDWVETNKQHHVEITEFPAKHYNIESKVYECYNLSSNKRHLIEEREIVRKLSHSEVILDFGSGIKGTIVGCSNVMPIVKVFNGVDWIASIMITALDTQTRELVESLLKAQEEE
jgi:hypothetical protein